MKKWQELYFTLIGNISVAMIIAGLIALFIEHKSYIEGAIMLLVGFYIFGYSILHAKEIEDRRS